MTRLRSGKPAGIRGFLFTKTLVPDVWRLGVTFSAGSDSGKYEGIVKMVMYFRRVSQKPANIQYQR
jgi:hypothetical protein